VSGWVTELWSVPQMTHQVIYGECKGGPHDGHRQAVTPDCEYLWIGPARAAWVVEAGITPEIAAGQGLHCYRWDGQALTGDGARAYAWIEPQGSG